MKNKRIIEYKCIYVLGNVPNGSNIIMYIIWLQISDIY